MKDIRKETSMGRLTYTDEEMSKMGIDCPVRDIENVSDFCERVCDEFQDDCPYMRMAEKLKRYEDNETQN